MNGSKPTVLVLMGGPDAERRISILSGRQVAQALRDSGRFDVREHVIDRPSGARLAELGGDVVFPVLHGRWGEGGPLQELLDALGVPYVGSEPAAARLAMDKIATKRLLKANAGVPVPADRLLELGDVCDLSPPVVLKPVDEGSSVDLLICRNDAQIAEARALLHPARGAVMVERYVAGREITVGIVSGRVLPLIEIVPSAEVEFYDYQAKYFRQDTRYVINPQLTAGMAEACAAIAAGAFEMVGCRDIARVDLMLDEDGPWFLEINTMPGFTTHSLVPMAAARAGRDMPALCAALVDAALARAGACAAAAPA